MSFFFVKPYTVLGFEPYYMVVLGQEIGTKVPVVQGKEAVNLQHNN